MGTWGYKVGENDSALDNIREMWSDIDYRISCLNPGFSICDTGKMLCAVAMVYTSFNGFDNDIWGLNEDGDYIQYPKRVGEDSVDIYGLCQAIRTIDIIKGIEEGTWLDEETWNKRKQLLDFIKSRLINNWNDLTEYASNNKKSCQ